MLETLKYMYKISVRYVFGVTTTIYERRCQFCITLITLG